MSKLYTFGDSASYSIVDMVSTGFTDAERREHIWPTVLAGMLKVDLENYSFPGSSNWRIARKLQNINLTKDDIVIIQWTFPARFEFGVNENYEYKNDRGPIDPNFEMFNKPFEEDNVRIKYVEPILIENTTDENFYNFMSHAYNEFNNPNWYMEMSRIMVASSLYRLKESGCKFLMTDVYAPNCLETDFEDVKEYFVRDIDTWYRLMGYPSNQKKRPTVDEHKKIAELVYENLNEIYGQTLTS